MGNKVLILGDIMMDTYILGDTSRISPEAPVPVLRVTDYKAAIGGAGNVANNIQHLSGESTILCVVGSDSKSDEMIEMLKQADIDTRWIKQDSNSGLITKARIIARNQQIVRLDYNDEITIDRNTENALKEAINASISEMDVAVISDYNKGTCTDSLCAHLIKKAKDIHLPVIVDPKGTSWNKYSGATIITPNLKELNDYSGKAVPNTDHALEEEYSNICEKVNVDYVLLTRSEKGMTLFSRHKDPVHIAAKRREVYDVSGAGDTVVATVATYLSSTADNIMETIITANIAAGIAVSKAGTTTVSYAEITKEKEIESGITKGKIFNKDTGEDLKKRVEEWKRKGERIVTTNGCFDVIHRGHLSLLEGAKAYGDKLIVLLNSDASVKRLKGQSRPINAENDRAYVIASMECVDAVYVFDPQFDNDCIFGTEWDQIEPELIEKAKEAPMGPLKMIQPDIHVKGGDYSKEMVPEASFAKEFKTVCFKEGYSTTKSIEKAKRSDDDGRGTY